MRKPRYSRLFRKQLRKLKGKELRNVLKKRDEILSCENISHYKNLSYHLKKYKRVHVNDSYVILFFGDDGTVNFVDYEHHDIVYNHNKRSLKRYDGMRFD